MMTILKLITLEKSRLLVKKMTKTIPSNCMSFLPINQNPNAYRISMENPKSIKDLSNKRIIFDFNCTVLPSFVLRCLHRLSQFIQENIYKANKYVSSE